MDGGSVSVVGCYSLILLFFLYLIWSRDET